MEKAKAYALIILFTYSFMCTSLVSQKSVSSSTATYIQLSNQFPLAFTNSKVTINATILQKGTSSRIKVDEVVKITITKPDSSQIIMESKPNQRGDYIFEVTLNIAGSWHYVIDYSGDSTYSSSTVSAGFMVLPQEETQGTTSNFPQVKLELRFPSFAFTGSPVNVTATMDPLIPGAILKFMITDPNGTKTTVEWPPNLLGAYLYTFTPKGQRGGWTLKVEWGGNAAYAKSECVRYLMVLNHGDFDTSVEFKVIEKINAAPYIAGVTIKSTAYPSGSVPLSVVTGGGGYTFHTMTPGQYTFSFTKPGYVNATDTVTVREGDQQHRNVFLEKVGSISTSTSPTSKIPSYPIETIILGLFIGLTLIYLRSHQLMHARSPTGAVMGKPYCGHWLELGGSLDKLFVYQNASRKMRLNPK